MPPARMTRSGRLVTSIAPSCSVWRKGYASRHTQSAPGQSQAAAVHVGLRREVRTSFGEILGSSRPHRLRMACRRGWTEAWRNCLGINAASAIPATSLSTSASWHALLLRPRTRLRCSPNSRLEGCVGTTCWKSNEAPPPLLASRASRRCSCVALTAGGTPGPSSPPRDRFLLKDTSPVLVGRSAAVYIGCT